MKDLKMIQDNLDRLIRDGIIKEGTLEELGIPIWHWRETLYKNKSFHLMEAYKCTKKLDCLDFLKTLKKAYLKEITETDFKKYCDDKKISFELSNGQRSIGGYFDLNEAKITILLTKDVFIKVMLADEQELGILASNLWCNYTHEHTHMQQAKVSKIGFKNYKPSAVEYWDEDFGKSFDYFNQTIEADAYGREIAARLSSYYVGETVLDIFERIRKNDIDDKYSKKIINIYKDFRIDKEVMKHFYRALYDALIGNEDEE